MENSQENGDDFQGNAQSGTVIEIADIVISDTNDPTSDIGLQVADINKESVLTDWKSECDKHQKYLSEYKEEMASISEDNDKKDMEIKKLKALQKGQEDLESKLAAARSKNKAQEEEISTLKLRMKSAVGFLLDTNVPIVAETEQKCTSTTIKRIDTPKSKKPKLEGHNDGLLSALNLKFPCYCGKTKQFVSVENLKRHLKENNNCLPLFTEGEIKKLFSISQYLSDCLEARATLKKAEEAQLKKSEKRKKK